MAGIAPGLDGYIASRQLRQNEDAAQMQQAQGLMGILAKVRAQEQEKAFRGALSSLGPDAPPEKILGVAQQFADPGALMTSIQGAQNKKLQVDANKEAKLANMLQRAQLAQRDYDLSVRRQDSKEVQDELRNRYQSANLALSNLSSEYNIGKGIVLPNLTAPSARPQGQSNFATPGGMPPMAQQGAPPMPMPAPQAAPPMPAPAGMPQQVSLTDMLTAQSVSPQGDMNDRRYAATQRAAMPPLGQTVPTQNVVRPAPLADPNAPKMPEFKGPPRDVIKAQNSWILAQSKAGEKANAPDAVVDAIIDGRMAVPSGFALRSPYWQNVIERVAAKDPKFDATKYGARAAARRTFASGPEAKNVTALNTVIGHLGTLDEAATAMNNGDIRMSNAVFNRLATETGDPRVQNFNTAKQAVAEETMRVFRQVGASATEAEEWGKRITSSGSPAQLRGVISTLGTLLDSRVDAIASQYERTVNSDGNPARVDPKNRKTLDRLKGGGGVKELSDEALLKGLFGG